MKNVYDKYKDTLAPYSFSFVLAEMDRNVKLLGEVWTSIGIVAGRLFTLFYEQRKRNSKFSTKTGGKGFKLAVLYPVSISHISELLPSLNRLLEHELLYFRNVKKSTQKFKT